MNGVAMMILSKNLGHADSRMCERFYAHLAPSHVSEVIRAGAPRFDIQPDEKIVALR
jgi:hypothetical protein